MLSRNHSPQEHPSGWVRWVMRIVSLPGFAWMVLALSLVGTAFVCREEARHQRESRRIRFEADAAILRNAMLERLQGYARFLQGGSGLFAACDSLDTDDFRAYAGHLELTRHYPGILAFGYVERVEQDHRDAWLRQLIREADPVAGKVKIWPEGERRDYLVVRFVEPLASNQAVLGYDLGSEAVRREAAMAAAETGATTLTARIELVQSPGKPGVLLLQPVYRGAEIPDVETGTGGPLLGWVYAAFLPGDMMDAVGQLTRSTLHYEIFDGTDPHETNRLGGSPASSSADSVDTLTDTSQLSVYGRQWTLRLHARAPPPPGSGNLAGELLASGGFCMSLLLFGIVHSIATTSRRASSLAADMTENLRRHDMALDASQERLAMVIEGSNDGVWDWDIATSSVYFSPRWKSMLGFDDHEIPNTFASWEALLHPDDRQRSLEEINRYFDGQAPVYQLEHRLRHKDGNYRWILARGVASRDQHGRPLRMAGSHVDLTELKQAEHDLRRSNEELLHSQAQLQETLSELRASHEKLEKTQLELIQAAKLESVGTLAAGVAHEVKNPLQIILMGLDFLQRSGHTADDATRVTLSDMRDAVVRADSISRELLQFSSASDFTPVPSDLTRLIDRSLWLTRTDITKASATVVRNLAGNLPPLSLDPPKIQQVLINLILNALQAMGHGGRLTITTSCGPLDHLLPPHEVQRMPWQSGDTTVLLRIHDSGPGIPENQLPKIFDPFFSTKAVGSGTGLGLSVGRRIIDLHGAFISIRNAAQGGLEVTLAFATAPAATEASHRTPHAG